MSVFTVDIDKLSKWMLPLRLRTVLLVDLVKCAVKPTKQVYQQFLAHRSENIYEIVHNGQVCKLEAVLNDRFDNTLRRVYIIDGLVILPLFTYKRVEVKPIYLRKRSEATGVKYLRKRSEHSLGGTFIINVPSAITFDTNEMKALTNKYKQAGKAYSIQTF